MKSDVEMAAMFTDWRLEDLRVAETSTVVANLAAAAAFGTHCADGLNQR